MKLIIDIETVSQLADFTNLPVDAQEFWKHKSGQIHFQNAEEVNHAASYFDKAAIYAEFGKIICISIGIVHKGKRKVRIKTWQNDDEFKLIVAFFEMLQKLEVEHQSIVFCGHNIKEFDLPYICRRALIQGISLPKCLQLSGLKPWENKHLDTLELWRFGDYKHYISLDLLAHILHVPSSKTELKGADVNQYYWKQKNLDAIAQYCARDVFTTALVYLKLNSEDIEEYEPEWIS